MSHIPKTTYKSAEAHGKKADVLKEALLVIILYKTTLLDSLTFQSLMAAVRSYKSAEPIDLLIYDNSPTVSLNINQLNEEGLFRLYYLHDPLNPGVSRPYNRAAEIANVKNKQWLFLFDQDTVIPVDGLSGYNKAVMTYANFPIYAPKVYDGRSFFSPCRYWFWRGSNLPDIDPGIHLMAHRNVLNSGLLISLNAFQLAGGYDEEVPFYFSDFVFFDRLKKHFREFIVVDCQLEHQLSSADFSDITLAITRFTYYCRGARQASRSKKWSYLMYALTVGLRSLKMSYRFKSIEFVKLFVTIFFIK